MTIKNHKLTAGIDKIVGGSDHDVFNAPLHKGDMTLGSKDVLDGGKGSDEVQATLADGSLDPTMKRIEWGVFTADTTVQTTLDLSRSTAMSHVYFSETDPQAGDSKIHVTHAANVSALAISNFADGFFELDNVDTHATKHFDLILGAASNTTVAMLSPEAASFRRMDIHLVSSSATLETTAGAKDLVVHSLGSGASSIIIEPVFAVGAIENVTLVGKGGLGFGLVGDANAELRSLNSSGLKGGLTASFGSEHLHSVTNGDGDSLLEISDIGGTTQAPAQVKLGGGADMLTLNYAFDGETQHYDGGKGDDTIAFQGNGALLNQIKNFETIDVSDAGGIYDLKGMHLDTFEIQATNATTRIDNFSTDTTLSLTGDVENFLTVNVAEATSPLNVRLDNVAVGALNGGFNATNLSHLQLESYTADNMMYLGDVGTAGDNISLKVTGNSHLTLNIANASTTQISSVKIDDDAGVDLSGLVVGSQAFAATGVKIIGGDGDDVLVGGNGNDTISTGRGHNTVDGSFGADIVNLLNGKGADTLAFEFYEGSSYGAGHDTVNHFGAADIIDLSPIGTAVTFAANVEDMATGMADLSASQAVAFFNVADHTLYIDLNHDKQFDATHDMQIQLDGVDSFSGSSLLS